MVAVAALAASAAHAAAAAAGTVQSVSVSVRFTSNAPPAPMVDKIRFSAEQVGLKALQDKPMTEASQLELELRDLMGRIFNQVLGGYLVKEVNIAIQPRTTIDILLEPIPPFVASFDVVLEFEGGIHPVWKELLSAERDKVRDLYKNVFSDVPVLSDRWSARVLEESVISTTDLQELFPGFTVEPSLDLGEHTVLRLTLSPQGETVRMVTVKVRSATIPSLALERLKYDAATHADLLVGLPLGFAEKRHDLIAREITTHLENSDLAQTLRLGVTPRLMIERRARLVLIVESVRYSGFLRAKIALGREENNPDVEGHMGIFLIKNFEAFTEFNFQPGPVEFQTDVGVGWRLSPFLYAAMGRNVTDGLNRIWIDAYLSEDVIISWEKGVSENRKKDIEGSVKFKAHEFFSFDVVSDFNTDIWLRFNANL